MPRPDPVPNPRVANPHAWARFRTIMRWMVLLGLLCVAGALLYLYAAGGTLTMQMAIATAIGVFLTVMVATALMSLVFLSHGSGHDDVADDPFDER
jgi:uncharacterized membrane protein